MSIRLEGQKISLHTFEFTDEEVEEITRWNNNQQNLTKLGRGSQYSTVSLTKEWMDNSLRNKNTRQFAIRINKTNKLIGVCNIDIEEGDPSNCALGILIGEQINQGRGYGTEAVKLLIEFAFDELRAHRVHLIANEENKQAIRCYEKAGFKHCGTEHEVQWSQGRWHNHYHMELLKSHYRIMKTPINSN